ncbi:sulfite exporter TauE/SafE family protein [Ornithinimicrobium sp. LYQ121]|uniref:sulfite exporter TauE/SafE family protein n=1 Tax=Ornithinimicrobium sp. LYQ121 TaxID=3378801 RepID=UPI003853CFC4
MTTLLLVHLAGFAAQLVDGSLGMGYGVTSASLLLSTGIAPALASASVNAAQLGTTLSSGISHWKVGNVDWRIVRRLSGPGAGGGFAGATVLSSLDTSVARPVMAWLLLVLGVVVTVRFVLRPSPRRGRMSRWSGRRRFLGPLGAGGGFVNATGGGGWGPVVTSTLLATATVEPRRVIGSVATSEFVVTVAASAGFLVGLGLRDLDWWTIGALMLGGVVAAPFAALLAGRLPQAVLGVAVGGLIVLLNLGPVLTGLGAQEVGVSVPVVVGGVAAVWLGLLVRAGVVVVRARRSRPDEVPDEDLRPEGSASRAEREPDDERVAAGVNA